MSKRYNAPHRNRIIKTRVTEEEHADFMERLTAYGMKWQADTGQKRPHYMVVQPLSLLLCRSCPSQRRTAARQAMLDKTAALCNFPLDVVMSGGDGA